MELKLLTQRIKCVESESGSLRMFLVSLCYSMRLGVPFIAPRQLGAVGGKLGRPSLPSVERRTGQSGAPPDSYCSMSGARLPSKSSTVDRCSSGPVGAPDSPVNFSRTPLIIFPRATSSPRMTHRTVRCTTRRSGEF
jgi:hypothetical protein